MKTIIRLVLLLFIIGIVLTMVAFVSGVNLDSITSYVSDDEAYGDPIELITTTTIDTLDIDLATRNIDISVTTEDHVIVTYHEHEKDTWTISEANGTLNIIQTVKPIFFSWFNFKIASHEVMTVYIEIPSDWVLEYSLMSNTGDIEYVEGPLVATEISIESKTGDTDLENITMDSLLIRMDTGDASLKNLIVTGDLDAESDTGNIVLNNISADKVILDNATGKISATDLIASSLIADTSTDNVTLTDSTISGTVYLSTNTGNVAVTDSTGTGFDLSTNTGNIRFTSAVNLDLRYNLSTSTGHVSVNEEDQGDRHTTSSGDILLKGDTTTGNITVNVQD